MKISKQRVERLAKAWLAEAKRLRSEASCDCGCNESIPVGRRARFKQGHDAKLLRNYREKIGGILGLQISDLSS